MSEKKKHSRPLQVYKQPNKPINQIKKIFHQSQPNMMNLLYLKGEKIPHFLFNLSLCLF